MNIPFDTSIKSLVLSTRTRNCLADIEIYTVGQLSTWDIRDIKRITPGFGKKAAQEVTEAMAFVTVDPEILPPPPPKPKSLRDEFAMAALPAFIAMQADECGPMECSLDAYLFADAMMEARK